MTKISINEIAPHPFPLPSGERIKVRGSFGHWNLVIGYYLELGIWVLEFNLLKRREI